MKHLNLLRVVSLLILSAFAPAAVADDVLPKVAEKFELNGHPAYLYAAPKPAPGKPWLWFHPTLEGCEAGGAPITLKLIAGESHQGTPSFSECQELIGFGLRQAGAKAPTQ